MGQNSSMVAVSSLGQLVPGPAAAGRPVDAANNNLDLVRFGGRLYLAWRTAPSHFASAAARIEVSSAVDIDGPWRFETTVAVGADLREPRLVAAADAIHLFTMELGGDPKRFQPRRTLHLHSSGDGSWTEPRVAIDQPIVPWRIRRLDDRWALFCYRGAERMYSPRPARPTAEVRWSDDLEHWSDPTDLHEGGTELEMIRLDDGVMVGVTRVEGPGPSGSDVLVGRSFPTLRLVHDRRKFDSPNLIDWDGEAWMFARRSVAYGGIYDWAPRWMPPAVGIRLNQARWSVTRKRSAMWRIDVDTGVVRWMGDLPSCGDTSFAAVAGEADGSLLVADYSSPLGGDPVWLRGQLRPTVINLFRISR